MSLTKRIAFFLLICALACAPAFAHVITKQITLPQDVIVEGKLFKRGTYKMQYNTDSGELALINGKIVARVRAQLQQRDGKAERTEVGTILQGENRLLTSITFRGEDQTYRVAEGGTQTETAAQH